MGWKKDRNGLYLPAPRDTEGRGVPRASNRSGVDGIVRPRAGRVNFWSPPGQMGQASGGGLRMIATPTVTTQAVSSVADTTATGNGTVVSDGGATITQRGVCWGPNPNPSTADNTATASGTTGAYTVSITGLSATTTYHARAYAINAIGTNYGVDVSFTTQASGTLFASVDFETAGTFNQTTSPLTGGVGTIVTSPVVSSSHALAESGNSTNYLTYEFANNAALITHNPNGIWVVWWQAYDQAALDNAFNTGGGQFKSSLTRRLGNGSGQPGGFMIGHGSAFGSASKGEIMCYADVNIFTVGNPHTGVIYTANTYVRHKIWLSRDGSTSTGQGKFWLWNGSSWDLKVTVNHVDDGNYQFLYDADTGIDQLWVMVGVPFSNVAGTTYVDDVLIASYDPAP